MLASSGAHALVGGSYGGTAVISTGGAELLTDVEDSIQRSWLEFFTLLDVVAAECGCDPSTIDLSNKPRMYIASAARRKIDEQAD